MTGEPDEPDELLLARLRAADPGTDLPPADPTRVGRLLEDVMSDTDTHTHTDTRTRTPLTWLVAAAAVALIAVAGGLMFLGDDRIEPMPTVNGVDPTVTELTLSGSGTGRCMVPNADLLADAAYAVDAEVTEVAGGRATLEPTVWYAGEQTDQVEVAAGSADLEALIGAPRFEEGQRYLVAATDNGVVMVCGFSGPYDDELAALYAEAFGG